MKIKALRHKSSPLWPLLFLLSVYMSFSWEKNVAEHKTDYSKILEQSQSLFQQQRYAEALPYVLNLHEQFPNNSYYLQHLLATYQKMGDQDGRAATLEKLIDTAPAIVVQEVCPSEIYRDEIILLQKCATRLPDDPSTLLKLALIEVETGKLLEARTHLVHAYELFPTYADVHIGLGKLAEKEGRIKDAIKSYKEAQALRPDDVEIKEILNRLPADEQ